MLFTVHSEFALSESLAKAVGCDHLVGAGIDKSDIGYSQAINLSINIGNELGVIRVRDDFFILVPGDLWLRVGVDDHLELSVFIWVDGKVLHLRNLRHQVHVQTCLKLNLNVNY